MRDLAQQSFSKSSEKSKLLKVVIIALLIVGVVFFLNSKLSSGTTSTSGAVVLKDAPKGLTPVSLTDNLDILENGVNLSTDTATFKNVSGENAKATAVRKYGNGNFSMSVDATLPDPKGQKYQVWIVGGGYPLDAGFMSGSGNSWTLVFRDRDQYSKYRTIWLTREITSEDGKPEKHVLEGSF